LEARTVMMDGMDQYSVVMLDFGLENGLVVLDNDDLLGSVLVHVV